MHIYRTSSLSRKTKFASSKFFVLVFLICVTNTNLISQSIKEANRFFKNENYQEALNIYKSHKKTAKDPKLLLNKAICHYYLNQPDECLNDLSLFSEFKITEPKVLKYAGLSYLLKMDYDQAVELLKKYLATLNQKQADFAFTIYKIRQCGQAKSLALLPPLAYVENPGPVVNSIYDDFRPIYSPSLQNRIYFSSAREESTGGKRNQQGLSDEKFGRYFSDMYYIDLIDGNWTQVSTFEPLFNTPRHDIIQGFSSNGEIVYFSSSLDLKKFTFYSDTFYVERTEPMLPVHVKLPINGSKGDKDLFVFSDSLILFSSNSLPGYGGYDLFYVQKKDSLWLEPINFGPKINSQFDEVSPFLTKSGLELYFSSNNLNSLGGFDIQKVVYDGKSKKWTPAQNLGKPINSAFDDVDFYLSSDGVSAVFSSNRPESIGGKDLFVCYMKEQMIDQILYSETPDFIQDIEDNLTFEQEEKIGSLPIAREFYSRSIYFNPNEDILSATNVNQINKVVELMTILPNIQLSIYSHTFPESAVELDLYFSLKRAEKIVAYFNERKIPSSRIDIKACGSSYPLVTPMINGINSTLAEKNNRRIDFVFSNTEQSNLKVNYEVTQLPEGTIDSRLQRFNQAEKTLTFRLLIAQTNQMFKHEILNIYRDIIIEKSSDNNNYNYYLGNFDRYDEINNLQKTISEKYNIKAKIVPFYIGKILKPLDILPLMNEFPELMNYIRIE